MNLILNWKKSVHKSYPFYFRIYADFECNIEKDEFSYRGTKRLAFISKTLCVMVTILFLNQIDFLESPVIIKVTSR